VKNRLYEAFGGLGRRHYVLAKDRQPLRRRGDPVKSTLRSIRWPREEILALAKLIAIPRSIRWPRVELFLVSNDYFTNSSIPRFHQLLDLTSPFLKTNDLPFNFTVPTLFALSILLTTSLLRPFELLALPRTPSPSTSPTSNHSLRTLDTYTLGRT
jgi:hypothetical protein